MLRLVALALAVTGEASPPFSYRSLHLHELIARADLCVIGEITAVEANTVQVEVEQLGFGNAPGSTLTVKRFRDWTCAQRWTPYAVGQRCLYFLACSSKSGTCGILGAGGEGESPMVLADFVRLQPVDALEAFGNRTTRATPLLEEIRRYRSTFRLSAGRRWIEPAVSAEELERYRVSSVLAGHLCTETFAGSMSGDYRDPSARSPRASEAARFDLGIGASVTALAALPDLDGDGHGELVTVQGNTLELVRLSEAGSRSRAPIPLSSEHYGHAAACLGDLGSDGTLDLALGEAGFYRSQVAVGRVSLLSLDASGELVCTREFGLEDPAFGQLDFLPKRFGRGLACLGDLDGDGTVELAVSAGEATAWVWLVSLDATGRVARTRCVLEGPEAVMGPLSLAAIGDLDGDGVPDLAASAQARWGSEHAGTLLVLLLAREGSVRRRLALPGDERRGKSFGSALAALGDWDGDNVPDLAVGAPYGASRILCLKRDGRVKAERELAPGTPLPKRASFGDALVAVPRAQGGTRLLVAGLSAIEPGPKKWKWLRSYPSLWTFEP